MDARTLNRRKTIAVIVTLIFFILSMITRVYRLQEGDVNPMGYEVFAAGWLAVFNTDIYWLANPISVLAIIFFLLNKIRISLILSGVAFVFAVLFFVFAKIDNSPIEYMGSVESMGPGYYFWVASILTVFVSSIQLLRYSK